MVAEANTPLVQKWNNAISAYEKDFKKWEARVDKILKRYRDESRTQNANTTAKFNILWSNVQTIVPAVFARLPKPDVSRRFRDNDPVGRVAALILERALDFEIEHYPDYRAAMKNSVYDRFLPGRGVAWIRYEPHISTVPGVEDDGVQVTEDADATAAPEVQEAESLDYECAPTDYVHWKDFLHGPGRCWEEVPFVGRKVYMRKAALQERFGKVAEARGYTIDQIPLDTKPEEQKRGGYQDSGEYEACIYEIWDKTTGKAIWLSKSVPILLDELDDPLELEQFFPCPKPLYATLTTDSLVPVPDFTLYQDQANTLDLICDRIERLIQALQVKGVHDAAIPELARLFTEAGNTDLIPVKNWAAFTEKQGLKGAIDIVDLTPIFNALTAAYSAMEQQKAQVYEITGLSDIVRGQGDAAETATAQKLKGQYASLRLKAMQGEVSQFAAELLQLKAQVICKFFQPQTIAQIAAVEQLSDADKPHVPAAIALLKDNKLSDFRIEVSADSLVQIDEDAEKEQATELVGAIGKFMSEAATMPPEAAPFMAELLKWVVARYKIGKSIEGAIDQFADQAKQKAANPQPAAKDPAVEKQELIEQGKQAALQAEQTQERERFMAEQAAEQQRIQQEQAFEKERFQAETQREMMAQEREESRQRMEAALQAQADEAQRRFEALQADTDRKFELLMERMRADTELRKAEMGQETTLASAEISAQAAKDRSEAKE